MKYFLKIFVSFLLAFSIIIGGGLYFYLNYEDSKKNEDNQVEALDDKVKKERVNVLLMGVDSLDGTTTEGIGTRTDTMMLLSMDPETKTAFILSLPRDSRVKIPGRDNYDKLNHAHSYGGVELAISTVKELLQIPVHHYIRVDYNALYKTVDDVGGLEIDVPMDMHYEDPWADPPLSINLKKGLQTLNGDQAMQLLRFRKGYADQDLGRIKTQQNFLDALIRKVISPSSITKIPQYIETMYMYVDTDLSQLEILSLAKDAIKIDPDSIEKQTLVGAAGTINGISYYVVNENGMKEQLDFLLSGKYVEETDEVIGEEETVDSATTQASSDSVKISVYNGSGYRNIARRASDLLKIEDIVVTYTGNASSFENEETHIYYRSDKTLARDIKKVLGVGKIFEGTKSVDYNEPDIVIILGKDFKNG